MITVILSIFISLSGFADSCSNLWGDFTTQASLKGEFQYREVALSTKNLLREIQEGAIQISPDRKRSVRIRDNKVEIVDLATSEVTIYPILRPITDLSWSPDSKKIFVTTEQILERKFPSRLSFYLVDLELDNVFELRATLPKSEVTYRKIASWEMLQKQLGFTNRDVTKAELNKKTEIHMDFFSGVSEAQWTLQSDRVIIPVKMTHYEVESYEQGLYDIDRTGRKLVPTEKEIYLEFATQPPYNFTDDDRNLVNAWGYHDRNPKKAFEKWLRQHGFGEVGFSCRQLTPDSGC